MKIEIVDIKNLSAPVLELQCTKCQQISIPRTENRNYMQKIAFCGNCGEYIKFLNKTEKEAISETSQRKVKSLF